MKERFRKGQSGGRNQVTPKLIRVDGRPVLVQDASLVFNSIDVQRTIGEEHILDRNNCGVVGTKGSHSIKATTYDSSEPFSSLKDSI